MATTASTRLNFNKPNAKTSDYQCSICGHCLGNKQALITHQKKCSITLCNILDRLSKKLIPEDIFNNQETNTNLRKQYNLDQLNKTVTQLKDLNPYDMLNVSNNNVINDDNNDNDDIVNNDIYNNHHTLHTMPTKPTKPGKKQPNKCDNIDLEINKLVKDINTEEEIINDEYNDYYSSDNTDNELQFVIEEEITIKEEITANNAIVTNDNIEYEPILDEYLTTQEKDNIKDVISNLINNNSIDHYMKFKDKVYSSKFDYYEDLYIHIYYCDNMWLIDDTSSDNYITYINRE
jgi:hypothetical protein